MIPAGSPRRRITTGIRSRPRLAIGAAIVLALAVAVAVTVALAGRPPDAPPGSRSSGASRPATPADGPSDGASRGAGPTAPGAAAAAPGTPTAGAARAAGAAGAASGNTATTTGASDPGPPGSTSRRVVEPTPVAIRPPVGCDGVGSPTGRPLPSADERDGKRWVTAGRRAGRCDASSSTFHLRGVDTRLVWRSDADSFVALMVDASQGTEATAGFADADCTGPCSEAQAIVPAAGDYFLQVQAGDAPWEIEVQEYRAP